MAANETNSTKRRDDFEEPIKAQALRLTLAVAASIAAFVFTYRSQPHKAAPAQVRGRAGAFRGYACKGGCSSHEAGYNWAQDHRVTDRRDCPVDRHHLHSFTEGCLAYADEQTDADEGVSP